MELTAKKIASILRQNGYRLTPQRRAIIEAIAASHNYAIPTEIYQRVRQEYPFIGLATVYRVLNLLDKLKLICRVNLGSDSQGYLMRRPTGHHHHVVCSQCGRAVDFTECGLSQLEKRLSRKTGFEIEGHLLEFYGRCPDCCAKSSG